MEYVTYDKREEFNAQIAPHLDAVEALCKRLEIPFFFSAAVANSDGETVYTSRTHTAGQDNHMLHKDLMVNYVKVAAGFDVVLPDVVPDIEL